MSPPPRPTQSYADLESPAQMHADCLLVGHHLRLERAARDVPPSRAAGELVRGPDPRDLMVIVDEATARRAAALHLG